MTPEGERLEDETDAKNDDWRHVESNGGIALHSAEKVEEEGLVKMFQKIVQTPDRRLDQSKRGGSY